MQTNVAVFPTHAAGSPAISSSFAGALTADVLAGTCGRPCESTAGKAPAAADCGDRVFVSFSVSSNRKRRRLTKCPR